MRVFFLNGSGGSPDSTRRTNEPACVGERQGLGAVAPADFSSGTSARENGRREDP
jgi:hypothetical protein